MGDVQIIASVPSPDGTTTPATGSFVFTPTARRSVAGVQILPKPFQVNLVGGAADVVLAENDTSWLWRVDEYVTGVAPRTIYVSAATGPAKYADLVPVDLATLAPTAAPQAAWSVQLAATDARLSAGVIAPDPNDPGFFLIGA